jgi:hypothetical protein
MYMYYMHVNVNVMPLCTLSCVEIIAECRCSCMMHVPTLSFFSRVKFSMCMHVDKHMRVLVRAHVILTKISFTWPQVKRMLLFSVRSFDDVLRVQHAVVVDKRSSCGHAV